MGSREVSGSGRTKRAVNAVDRASAWRTIDRAGPAHPCPEVRRWIELPEVVAAIAAEHPEVTALVGPA